jgi:uncharacterized protein (TIGR02246 family)
VTDSGCAQTVDGQSNLPLLVTELATHRREFSFTWGLVVTKDHDMKKDQRHGSETDLTAIDKVRDAHVAALNAGDANAWVAQFTDDGLQMPPNAPANVGKAMIESWSKALLIQFRVQFVLSVDEVRVLGGWAFERGGYTISLNPSAGGPPMQDSGKYITIYQRSATDAWRMARDIWNSSNPPPKM